MSAGVCRKKKTYKIFCIFKLQTTLFWMFYVQRAQLGQPASHRKKTTQPTALSVHSVFPHTMRHNSSTARHRLHNPDTV